MGGSAIGGDLAMAALGDRATRPITVVRGYALESWIPPESLVLCASYSGDTEETLACFEAAGAAGAQRVVLTTGGTLAELARAEGVPVIGVPAGMQPRAAVVYMTVGALECAALCGAAPGVARRDRYRHGAARTARRGVGPGRAGGLARQARGARARRDDPGDPRRGQHRCGGAALEHPDQREREGTGVLVRAAGGRTTTRSAAGSAAAPTAPVLPASSSSDPDQHPRVQRRIELMAAEVERAGAPAIQVESRGESRLERVLSLVLLGDLVSVYLAVLAGVDPTPVEAHRALQERSLSRSVATNLDTIVVRFAVAMEGLTINEAAETTGWSPRMLRYIESAGLIEPPRTPNGLPHLRTGRAAAPANAARAARPVRLRPLGRRVRQAPRLRSGAARRPRPLVRGAAAAPPEGVDSGDWLAWEQQKHQRLLAMDTPPRITETTAA